MNERIRKLAREAGFIGESMNPIIGTCQETALKNFAELIVLECAIIVGSMEEPHQEIAQLVKEHFGVEE